MLQLSALFPLGLSVDNVAIQDFNVKPLWA